MPGHVEPFEDVLELRVCFDALFHLRPQLTEIALLLLQNFLAGQRAMPGTNEFDIELLGSIEDANPRCGIRMTHVVESPIGAGVPRAQDLLLRQVHKRIAGRVGMAQEEELDVLLAVVEHQLFVEEQVGHLEDALGHVLAPGLALAGICEFLGPVDPQEPAAIGLSHDARPGIGEHRVAIGMIAVMVRIEDVADRLVGGLLDGRDDVARLLGEVGVEDDDVILENDPDVIAAAEDNRRVRGADRRIAEEHAGGDLTHLVELHRSERIAGRHGGGNSEKAKQQHESTAHEKTPRC